MRKLVMMGEPHYGNLGDQAIYMAEKAIIDKYFSEYEKWIIPEEKLDICAAKVQKYINDDDIIFLQGGGNMGDIHDRPERGRRQVLKLFPNNKTIIFPQTVYFSDTEEGRKELEISKQIYNNHKNLIILAREEKSYNFMKEHFYNAKIYLTPDIVMSLYKGEDKERSGALLLFRADKEKTLEDTNIEKIKQSVKHTFGDYKLSDMYIGRGIVNIGEKLRDDLLQNKFNQFQTSKIAITDRLHGMIFAAITETPCVVFGNFNHKISESYKWLKNLEYIKFCENINDLDKCIEQVTNIKEPKYDNTFAEEKISEILKNEIL